MVKTKYNHYLLSCLHDIIDWQTGVRRVNHSELVKEDEE